MANSEKVLGKAARTFGKAAGEFIKDQHEKSKERNERARQARAERAEYNARMMATAQESYKEVMDLIVAHNQAYSSWMPIRLASDPKPVKECSLSTAFWDCEDPDCFFHKKEKQERGIGTPTRKYHPDFQAGAPKDNVSQAWNDLFGTV